MKIRERIEQVETLTRAVDLAAAMIKTGTSPGLAIWTASREYRVDKSDVARLCGSRGGKKRKETKHV